MQDFPQEINVGAFDELLSEEVVGHEGDSISELRGTSGAELFFETRQILHDASETWVERSEVEADVAC